MPTPLQPPPPLAHCKRRVTGVCVGRAVPTQTMIDDNHIDMDRDQVQLIKDMIASHHPSGGAVSHPSCTSRDFLYEIVANKRNGIDVDKVIVTDVAAVAYAQTTF